MPVKIACRCGRNLIVPDARAGRKVACPKCGHHLLVPAIKQVPGIFSPVVEKPAQREIAHRPATAESRPAVPPPLKPREEKSPAQLPPPLKKSVPDKPEPFPTPAETVAQPEPSIPIAETAVPPPTPPATAESPPPLIAREPDRPATTDSEPTPPPPPPPAKPERQFGYQSDADKLAASFVLATLVGLLGVFSMVPAALDVSRYLADTQQADPVGRWAFAVIFLGFMHVAYAFYLGQMPDWSSAWTLTGVTLLQGAIYAAVLTTILVVGGQSQIVQMLDLEPHIDNGQARAWCFVMLCLTGLVAYFCGRVSIRWRRAFLLLRTAKGTY